MSSSELNPGLESFAQVAQRYCGFIESFAHGRPDKLYTTLEQLLAELQIGILNVFAEMNDPEQPELETIEVTHEEWHVIFQLIGETTSKETIPLFEYYENFNKGESGSFRFDEMRVLHLDDDLSDIYRDIKVGLMLWELDTPESRIEASWNWRYNYEIHWGRNHLFSAAQTICDIRYGQFKD